ncbi:MAG: hypothetical protein LBT12_06280 [Oscillospiraceae bacterium]|jgi:hypothetical protein|nr:hypothetical protein [Oscillospiraceae bacterium]
MDMISAKALDEHVRPKPLEIICYLSVFDFFAAHGIALEPTREQAEEQAQTQGQIMA